MKQPVDIIIVKKKQGFFLRKYLCEQNVLPLHLASFANTNPLEACSQPAYTHLVFLYNRFFHCRSSFYCGYYFFFETHIQNMHTSQSEQCSGVSERYI